MADSLIYIIRNGSPPFRPASRRETQGVSSPAPLICVLWIIIVYFRPSPSCSSWLKKRLELYGLCYTRNQKQGVLR
ncbi:hypothetical protein Hgul01_01825 [Herpetosiphon gulosus]|uniref:Uncharacterized protein n=1 Tax=Herpetosiphon gulosus TaxID=1973496 RepID=A0ABP9WXZ8_9CHLR